MMTKLKIALAAGVVASALMGASAAQASPLLSYEVYDGATLIGSGSNGTGFILLSGSDSVFNLSGNAAGAPTLNTPDFSTNTFTLSSSGAGGVLTIKVTETGLTGYTGSNVMSTLTLNSLNGGGFTTGTISNYFDNSNTAYGTGTLLFSDTYNGKSSFSSNGTTGAVVPTPFSETSIFTLTFGAGATGTVSASSQLQNVPEPLTLSLFGAGIAGLVGMRRRKKAA